MSKISRTRVEQLERRTQAIGQAQGASIMWAAYLETEPADSALHMLTARGIELQPVAWTPEQLDAWRVVRNERRQAVARLVG